MERPFYAVFSASRALSLLIALACATMFASGCAKRKRPAPAPQRKPAAPAKTSSGGASAKRNQDSANATKTREASSPATTERERKRETMPRPATGATEEGIASWYGEPYHGRRAANGEVYDMDKLTAAHRTLPFGLWVHVENLLNNKAVEVRITDRGPFIDGRIIDLSRAAARLIDLIVPGTAPVRLTVVDPPAGEETPVQAPLRQPLPSQPAPSQAAPPPPPPVLTRFAVQVGAFSSRANAERLAGSLRAEFGHAVIRTREGSRPLHHVLAGQFETEHDARILASRLHARFRQAFVVSLDESR